MPTEVHHLSIDLTTESKKFSSPYCEHYSTYILCYDYHFKVSPFKMPCRTFSDKTFVE